MEKPEEKIPGNNAETKNKSNKKKLIIILLAAAVAIIVLARSCANIQNAIFKKKPAKEKSAAIKFEEEAIPVKGFKAKKTEFKDTLPSIGNVKGSKETDLKFQVAGVVAKTERRCFYFIKDVKHLVTDEELQKWLATQGNSKQVNQRQFHILKEHNDVHLEDKIICKILGTFYAVINKSVYTIGFMHSFKVRFQKPSLAK